MSLLQESYQLWSRWSSYSGALVQVNNLLIGKSAKKASLISYLISYIMIKGGGFKTLAIFTIPGFCTFTLKIKLKCCWQQREVLQNLIVQHFINLGHEKSAEKQGIPFNIGFLIKTFVMFVGRHWCCWFVFLSTWREHVALHTGVLVTPFYQRHNTIILTHGNVCHCIKFDSSFIRGLQEVYSL